MPMFPGGDEALLKYLGKNIKYTRMAQDRGVQGTCIIEFVVNKDGSVVDPVVLRKLDPDLDNNALEVVKKMPRWQPGLQRGKPVRVKYRLPVAFRLT